MHYACMIVTWQCFHHVQVVADFPLSIVCLHTSALSSCSLGGVLTAVLPQEILIGQWGIRWVWVARKTTQNKLLQCKKL